MKHTIELRRNTAEPVWWNIPSQHAKNTDLETFKQDKSLSLTLLFPRSNYDLLLSQVNFFQASFETINKKVKAGGLPTAERSSILELITEYFTGYQLKPSSLRIMFSPILQSMIQIPMVYLKYPFAVNVNLWIVSDCTYYQNGN